MTTIYIVEGSTGEYSDHCEWPVKAYRNERRAKEHAEKASARAREIYQERYPCGHYKHNTDVPVNEFDPDMVIDYTGTHYSIVTVELDEEENGET